MKILAIDIGGTNVKVKCSESDEARRFPSGKELSARQMVDGVVELTKDWSYDVLTVGFPGPIVKGQIGKEPANLGKGWLNFDFEHAFGKPTKLINDAAMQALGSYEGGRMLFLGLGTGLGNALIIDGVIAPMELGHLPYKKKRTFEDYVGIRGLERLGKQGWQKAVYDVVSRLKAALIADYVVLGGGNAKKLKTLPEGCRLGHNENAFLGGFRLWKDQAEG
ncbi:MAG: ROK family protein [Planctomycetes bacterium]|nr:ROK family protein [Planctomycetota bacterium]